MKRIKLFLAAYVNFPNAQNINCDCIARFINKDKFEVHVMYTNKMHINKEYYEAHGIILHKLIHHRFIWYWSKLLTMMFANCDIYYLPKGEEPDFLLAKILNGRKKLVSSIEGVITETINNSMQRQNFYRLMDDTFVISKCIRESVYKQWKMSLPLLPLGVQEVNEINREKAKIETVIWVGNITANKRPLWLIEVAKHFPELNFLMIGDGELQEEINRAIRKYGLDNIHITGRITNEEVYQKMINSDLLLMTSEYEGLPKVIQEAAQCGVPSIYINQNYTVDFIRDGINGYGVQSLDEMIKKIAELVSDPDRYQNMSNNAKIEINPYRWSILIQKYEDFFESLVK